jgi:hypothetical protein
VALSTVDPDFAKEQLDLMLQTFFLHPTGQIPAYEWNFSDVNPPVHAWASIFLYRTEQALKGTGDLEFLKRSFAKLLLNFSWWINRKDRFGKNLFEGGFLGLDNIGVFDRSSPLPTGGYLEQADGTAWVSLFSQNMLEMAVELAANDSYFEDMALKFAEHFIWIARAMNQTGPDGMWDEEDGFTTTCCGSPMAVPGGSRSAPWWASFHYSRSKPWSRNCSTSCPVSSAASNGFSPTARTSPRSSPTGMSRAVVADACCHCCAAIA